MRMKTTPPGFLDPDLQWLPRGSPEWQAKIDSAVEYVTKVNICLRKSAAERFEAGRLLREAKRDHDGLWSRCFKDSKDPLPQTFDITQEDAQLLMRIAGNPTLGETGNFPFLPRADSTLDELSRLDPEVLQGAVDRREITPQLTCAKAKQLVKQLQGPAATDEPAQAEAAPAEAEWTRNDAEDRLRIAAWEEVRQCPKGEEAGVEEMLRRLADEFLGQRARWQQITPPGWDRVGFLAVQLIDPQAGQRIPIHKRRGGNTISFMREPSTFPAHMFGLPRDQRGADRLKDVIDHFNAGKICGEAERRVLDWAVSWSDEAGDPEPPLLGLGAAAVASDDIEAPAGQPDHATDDGSALAVFWRRKSGEVEEYSFEERGRLVEISNTEEG